MSILVVSKPTFQRAMRVISSITNANPAVVTTTTNHQYITGMIVRLNIPTGFGMQQVSQQQGVITVTGATTFQISIDTTYMDAFVSLISAGTTDGSGALSGTISTNIVPLSVGQSFTIGSETCLVIGSSGAMYCNGGSAGTFAVSSGDFSISGALENTPVAFNQVYYPQGNQYAQCTPVGEVSSTLQAATQNVLGTGFYN